MLDVVLITGGLIGLIYGSFTDIKYREVPDWLIYGMVISGLLLRLVYGLFSSELSLFFFGVLGVGLSFGVGYLLFMFKVLGGGDVKIITGLGAFVCTTSVYPYFFFHFLLVLFFFGGFYGISFALYDLFINKKGWKESILRQKEVPLSAVTEGDWLAKDVYHAEELILSKDVPCLTEEHIAILKGYNIPSVVISYGIPFVPCMLICYILTLSLSHAGFFIFFF